MKTGTSVRAGCVGAEACREMLEVSGKALLSASGFWARSRSMRNARRRFSHDEFGVERDLVGIGFVGRLDAFNEKLRGSRTHFMKRLAHGGEAGIGVGGD